MKASIVSLSKLDEPDEQKKAIFKTLGDLDQYEMLDEELLIALYAKPNVLAAGKRSDGSTYQLVGTDNDTIEASRYQGKIGLLITKGPSAYKYHPNGQPYQGIEPEIGDWLISRASDGREIWLKDLRNMGAEYVCCRRIHWTLVGMRITDPRTVK